MPAHEINALNWFNAKSPPSLESLRGNIVLLEFWATWCPFCVKASPRLDQLAEKYKQKGLFVIALSGEPLTKVQPFLAKKPVKYIVGAGSTSSDDFGVDGIPQALLIDRQGTVIWEGSPNSEELEKSITSALDASS